MKKLLLMFAAAAVVLAGCKKDPDPVKVTGVTLNKTSLTLAVGASETLTATVAPADAADKAVTWTSSAPAVAAVDASGKVTAVAAGSAAIVVTTKDGNKTATASVTVTDTTTTPIEPPTPPVATYPITGTTGSLSWSLAQSGTLTISGTGAMPDYAATASAAVTRAGEEAAPWAKYATEIKRVVVQTGVTSVGNNAFAGLGALTSVSLAEGIESIGAGAFAKCAALTAVALPATVETILDGAFADCAALASVTLPAGLESIGDGAFEGCSALEEITVPAGTEIGDGAFPTTTEVITPTTPPGGGGGGGGGGGVTPPPAHVAVTGITGVPTTAQKGIQLTLTGTVAPENATNKTIVWSVKSAGTTGAAITDGNKFDANATGEAVITATIANGLTASTPYTQDFDITVGLPPLVTAAAITGATAPKVGYTPGTGMLTPGNATYTARITEWEGDLNASKFDYGKVYTATIELTQVTGYTFEGGFENLASIAAFTVNGNAPTAFIANNGTTLTYKVAFPATPSLVTAAAIGGVTSPLAGATPSTAITNGTGFTAALVWEPTPALIEGKFNWGTIYTARITLTATSGYTFAGAFGDTAAIAGFTVNSQTHRHRACVRRDVPRHGGQDPRHGGGNNGRDGSRGTRDTLDGCAHAGQRAIHRRAYVVARLAEYLCPRHGIHGEHNNQTRCRLHAQHGRERVRHP